MIKNILLYNDTGVDPLCFSSLLCALSQAKLDQSYTIVPVRGEIFARDDWQAHTHLVIIPGGRDIPYHLTLQGKGNRNIRAFVEQGGNFLGICAGAYFGCARIEFEKGGPLEIIAERELQFFPGIARGPAYGSRTFAYQSQVGSRIAKISTHLPIPSTYSIYYNGGCLFTNASLYPHVSTIASYTDIENMPAAIIQCQIGKGTAILSGVHPEVTALCPAVENHLEKDLLRHLLFAEKNRLYLFTFLLQQLQIKLRKT